jgi:hypothetical protein
MLVELGPVAAADVRSWTRFARRVLVELGFERDDLPSTDVDDLLSQWSLLIDEWAARSASGDTFRWSRSLDAEVAEFLLHGLERAFTSRRLQARITAEESRAQRPFTLHVIQAFVDGLASDDVTHQHYADQIRASFGSSID